MSAAASKLTHNLARYLGNHLATPERVLYRHHADGKWLDFTAHAVGQRAARWQEAMRRAGLQAGDRVALCLKNSVNWVAIDQAALGLGLVVVPLYVDDNAENIAWCVTHSGAKLLVVENARMAKALTHVAGDVAPDSSTASAGEAGPVPLTLCLKLEADEMRADLCSAENFLPPQAACPAFVAHEVAPDQLATICYTSGTSGRPKGVMLSHRNITANVTACASLGIARPDDVFLSFLPLSHMFERTGGYYLPLSIGAKVVYARSVTHLPDDLLEQKPTALFAVPRIFEKFAARIEKELAKDDKKRKIFERVVAAGWAKHQGTAGIVDHFMLGLLRKRAAAAVLDRLGGRLRLAVVGGAALDARIARTFIGLGLPLMHGYGMTEASPVISVNPLEAALNDPASVGPALPDIEVRLSEAGELLVRGPSVMQGYLDDPAATARVLHDGWLHTGDLCELRAEPQGNRIFIRGRLKDVLVLSNGEKLPPQDVELAILADDVFEQGMLVGEGKPFLTLLAVSQETDERALMKRANERLKAFPRYVRIRRVVVSKEPWSVDNGLLTPTLKVKRSKVLERFAAPLEAVYADGGPSE